MPTPQEIQQMKDMAEFSPTQAEQNAMSDEQWLLAQGSQGVDASAIPGPQSTPKAQPAAAPEAAPAQAPSATKYLSDPNTSTEPTDPYKVVGYAPAGSQTSVSRTDLGQAGQDAFKAQDQALQATAKAQEQQTSIAEQKASVIAQGEEARAAEMDRVAKAQAARAQKLGSDALKRANDIDGSVNKFLGEADNIDANRYWAKQSTGQFIGNMIAIALSGVGNALQARGGNPNAKNGAWEMINQFIERDVETQRMQMQAKERGISMKMNAYSIAKDAGATDDEAKTIAEEKGLQKAEADVRAKLAKLGPGQEKANGEALLAQIQQRRADLKMQFAQMNATHIQQTEAQQPILAGQVQAQQQAQAAKDAGLVPVDPKLATPYGQAPDPETRRIMLKMGAKNRQIENEINIVSKGSATSLFSPGKKKEIDAAWSRITGWLKGPDVQNAGASLTDEEKALLLDPNLSDSSIFTRESTRTAAINGLKKLIEARKQEVDSMAVKTHL